MPPKQNPTLYSISKTFIGFALTSLVLLGSLVAIVILDHHREWKDTQKKFIELKTKKAQAELHTAIEKIDKAKLETLKKEYADAGAVVQAHRADRQALQKETDALDTAIAKTKIDAQGLKQFEDSYKYFLEEYVAHKDPRAGGFEQKLKVLRPRLDEAKLRLENLEKAKDDKNAQMQKFLEKEKNLEKEIDKLLEEKNRMERRLEKIKPTMAKEILNAPMIDFLAPTLRIQQVVLEDLSDDYHFTKVPKVDRCTTCHLGIDQKGFEDAPQPFRTHPKLDLYLGSNSPHPLEKVGCTVCHGGNGHSVSFKDSAHTPQSQEQRRAWVRKYHWEELEKWDAKMLPMNHIEAACAKCHQNTVWVPQADKLNKGRKLAEVYGCFGCHKVAGMENRWKVGPDLKHLGSKVDQAWVERWLQDPRGFRHSTQMPQIFNLSNTSSPEDKERNLAAIHSIAAYLIKNSETVELEKPKAPGDKARGEKLVKELGCLGCHTAAGTAINNFGPELSNLGSKVSPEWLYSWLKNPKHYSTQTRMPNLRLSDEEASDITSYLLSEKNENFDNRPIGQARPEVLDDMILSSLQGTMRRAEAEKELSEMTPDDKLQALGKKSITHQGCFACHTIKGFEDAKPIGTELSNEGKKDIHQLDFGFVNIEHSRQSFFIQKLKEPRIFDHGKIKTYYEKLRMPQFNFTDDEIEALTTFLLSLTQEQIPPQMQKGLDLKERQIEKGRLLVSKFNCNGCHTLDGTRGALRESLEDKGQAPPILDGEGAKVQEKWLHAFLKEPQPIRPWLTYRMPTFNLKDEEIQNLVEYFTYLAHQEVSYQGLELPETSSEKVAAGKGLFDKLQCAKCHELNPSSAAMGASFLAPDLKFTHDRLKPDWVRQWLTDPQMLQEGTLMPTFFSEGQSPIPDVLGGDANQQIEAIRDYLYRYREDSVAKSSGK